jgi:Fe-S-cluster containining protein
MLENETLFLTAEQALEAVCIDFRGYEPQPMMFCEILRTLSGEALSCKREPGKEGLWIAARRHGPMRWLEGEALVAHMCRTLRRARPESDQLASICRRVFQTPCRWEASPRTGQPGIRVQIEMEGFACRQCGRCCHTLTYRDSLMEEDVARLKALGRHDILAWVGVTRTRDGQERHRIWMTPGTNQFAAVCPFLRRGSSSHRWSCAIHDVRPLFCRNYPLSRKHASMNGCQGFAGR